MEPTIYYKQTRQKLFDAAGIQPESKMITTDGPVKNVHYLEIGSGKPLILIHGGGAHASQWINIIKPLAQHFHLYIVDRPGCGLTDTINYRDIDYKQSAIDFVRSFMDAVGLEQAMFTANSMGGYFSICFSLEYAERVEKLLLIGAPAGMNHWIPLMPRLMGTKGLNSFMMRLAKPNTKMVRMNYKQLMMADASKLSDDFLKHELALAFLPDAVKSMLTMFESVLTLKGFRKDLYIGDKLSDLKIPVRFIWGDKDVFEKPDTGLSKAKAINDYKFEVVENAGHAPWLDQPQKCAELMIKMLKD